MQQAKQLPLCLKFTGIESKKKTWLIEAQRQFQLELVKGNKEEEDKINEKFDKKAAALKTKQAKADKKRQLYRQISALLRVYYRRYH